MSTIVAQTLIDRAARTMQDVGGVRWTAVELLGWLNDAQREVARIKPDAYMVSGFQTLVAGTKQTLPADGVRLADIVRNWPNGTAIRRIDRLVLDSQTPGWHSATASAVVQYFTFNPQTPRLYYVYPPQPAVSPGSVEIVYMADPPDILAADTLSVQGIYANALLDYMLYRGYSKDAEYAANQPRAEQAYKAFLVSVGGTPPS